jgi:hypothetical protein
VFFPSPEELVRNCGKMALLDRLLNRLLPEGHKVLIFSQVQCDCKGSAERKGLPRRSGCPGVGRIAGSLPPLPPHQSISQTHRPPCLHFISPV